MNPVVHYHVLHTVVVVMELVEPGNLRTLLENQGGLLDRWLAGGMFLFKLLARQILSLMLTLQSQSIVARCLRPEDIYISIDGSKVRIHRLRFASFAPRPDGGPDEFALRTPSLRDAAKYALAPEFFFKNEAANHEKSFKDVLFPLRILRTLSLDTSFSEAWLCRF